MRATTSARRLDRGVRNHEPLGLFARLLASERGQTVVMFSLGIVALIGFSAIVFDAANIYLQRRELQNAADGAALAAARELPDSPSNALKAAKDYLAANGYTTTDVNVDYQVNTPYLGDPGHVEVSVTQVDAPYLFARVLGLTSLDISARAVAEIVTAYNDSYAIFAINSDCASDGAVIGGSLTSITGTVHSNSSVYVSGTDTTIDPAITYHCSFKEDGSGHSYTREQKSTGVRNLPNALDGIDYDSFAPCTFYFPNNVNLKAQSVIWQDPGKTLLVPGVYCFGRDMTLIGDNITGHVTFAAKGHITVSGSDHNLWAYHSSGILFYSESSTGVDQISLNGADGSWSGITYAPYGDISLGGQGNLNYDGGLVGQNVEVSGNGVQITAGTLGSNSDPVVRLIE
jgi:Flp pilus assembly protein TadG